MDSRRKIHICNPELEPDITCGAEPFPVQEGLHALLPELLLLLRQSVIVDFCWIKLTLPANASVEETHRDLF